MMKRLVATYACLKCGTAIHLEKTVFDKQIETFHSCEKCGLETQFTFYRDNVIATTKVVVGFTENLKPKALK